MPNYISYKGQFYCHECKEEVGFARLYEETFDLTWMCKSKHLSKVAMKKKGYR